MGDLILVSGLGRCGTSLMMQMLAAGGLHVFEPEKALWPAFEHPVNMSLEPVPPEASGLLKWLEPQRFAPPGPAKSIFLTRNNLEQAKSQTKWLRALANVPTNRDDVRRMAAGNRRDEPLARSALARVGPLLHVHFEELVLSPLATLRSVESFLGLEIDWKAALACARPRGVHCLPYLLEADILEQGQ